MHNEATTLCKLPLANGTLVLTQAGMRSSVVAEGTTVCELLVADSAGKRLFLGVDSRMHLQRSGPLELHTADAAPELRRLAEVSPQVLFESARLREVPPADEAGVWLGAAVGP